jgi:hypothetical protein
MEICMKAFTSLLAQLERDDDVFSPFGAAPFASFDSSFSTVSARGAFPLPAKAAVPSGEITILPERDVHHHETQKGALAAPPQLNAPATTHVPAEILVDGTIEGDEIDGYLIDLEAGQTYLFSVYGSGATPLADTVLYLFDGDGNFIDLDDDGGAGTNSLYTYTAAVTGTFILGVSAFPGAGLTGQYTLDAVQAPPADDVADDFANATPLTIGTVAYGFIEADPGFIYPGLGEVDTYRFTAEAGLVYSIEVAGGADYASDPFNLPPGELDTVIFIYNANGDLVAVNDDINFPSDVSSRVSFFAEESGEYFIDVVSYEPWTGGYSITSSAANPADFNPLDAINWASANNVPFDATNTAYVYFAAPGESFGELADDGVSPLPSFGWNDFEKQQLMLALEQYEKILGVNYVITDDVNQATFRVITTESDLYGAYMYPQDPVFGTQQGIAAFNVLSGGWSADQQQSLLQGGFAFAVILHEFGHGHGLAHPHDNGGGSEIMLGVTGPFGSYGIYDLNQGVYTIMSYNDAWDLNPAGPSPFDLANIDNGWSGTLSALDIAILQERYGVINPYATGNTTYTLKDVNDTGTYYETIWDTGGNDVIRYDGLSNAHIDLLAATIDYSPTGGGVVSFVDGIWGGFTIARGVVIEDAIGGGGHDEILGNAAVNVLRGNAGDDVLVGRGGGDTLNGGLGFDVASYIDATSGVRATLGGNRNSMTGDAQGDTFISIEGLQGSQFGDTLSGNDRGNRLDGLGGDDTLTGGNGRDTLLGGSGNDTMNGGDNADTLDGGDGNDVMRGGDGRDTFIVSAGLDRITDFSTRFDKIDISGTGLVFADLDTNGNGRLDNADAYVDIVGRSTVIDFGAALGLAPDLDTLTVNNVSNLRADSFIIGV